MAMNRTPVPPRLDTRDTRAGKSNWGLVSLCFHTIHVLYAGPGLRSVCSTLSNTNDYWIYAMIVA